MCNALAGFSLICTMHMSLNIKLLYKIYYATDSDEIHELALWFENNLPKDKIFKFKKMLNNDLKEDDLTFQNINNIKRFRDFLD